MKSFYPYLLRFAFGAVTVVLISFPSFGLAAVVEDPPDFITKWGSPGSGDGQFSSPYGAAVDTADNVYVADTYNHRIQKFDSEGNFIIKWGSYGWGDGQLRYPQGVAVDSADNVCVVDTYNYRIQKFDSDGNFLTKWGSGGSGDSQFNYSFGVAADTADNGYVADTHNHRIQKFGLTMVNNLTIEVDIKPGSCVNPLNVKSKGVLPVAILGSRDLDGRHIDTRTIRLSSDGTELEVRPIRGRYEDVSTSSEGELYDCHGAPDGYEDLSLKFRTRDVVAAIGKVNDGEAAVLTITGTLIDQTEFAGTDYVKIIKKGAKRRRKNNLGEFVPLRKNNGASVMALVY